MYCFTVFLTHLQTLDACLDTEHLLHHVPKGRTIASFVGRKSAGGDRLSAIQIFFITHCGSLSSGRPCFELRSQRPLRLL